MLTSRWGMTLKERKKRLERSLNDGWGKKEVAWATKDERGGQRTQRRREGESGPFEEQMDSHWRSIEISSDNKTRVCLFLLLFSFGFVRAFKGMEKLCCVVWRV